MFISDFAIRRPIITVVAMVALVVFGIAALLSLQTDEFPDIQQPIVVRRRSPYPGASPEDVEREVVEPDRGRDLRHQRRRQDPRPRASDGFAQIIVVLRVREGHPAGDAGHPRRDLRPCGPSCPPR